MGLTTGGATVLFGLDAVTVALGDSLNVTSIAYETITGLQFGGRGAFVERSGGRWIGGGFGAVGAIEGALMASVFNVLTSKRTAKMESIMTLSWGSGQIILLNQEFPPETLAHFLHPVITRLREAQANMANASRSEGFSQVSSGSPDLVSALRQLGEIHASGVLSDEEFHAAKATVLGRGANDNR